MNLAGGVHGEASDALVTLKSVWVVVRNFCTRDPTCCVVWARASRRDHKTLCRFSRCSNRLHVFKRRHTDNPS